MTKKNRPIIALPMGDAAGIGPEIVAKAVAQLSGVGEVDLLVIGDVKIMRKAAELVDDALKINICQSVGDADFSAGVMNIIDLDNLPVSVFASGKVDPAAGKAAVEYLEAAVTAALADEIDAIASAPVNKEAMHLAGYDFAGVTELLGHLTGSRKYAMVLVLGPIRLFYVTNHVSMRQALDAITFDAVLSKIRAVNAALADFGITHGKIAVAALNPHGGEGGAMGAEELEHIIPAVEAAKREGINAIGPLPADTIFIHGKAGEFDAIVAMHHDQGNIALKIMDLGPGVTVVAGLPIIRTSVAHGTAFDIAGESIASPDAFIAAIRTAGEIAIKRKRVDKRITQ